MEVRKYKTIMTKLFLKMSWANPLRDPSLDVTLLVDSQTKEIYKYQSFLTEGKKPKNKFKVNEEHHNLLKSYADPEKEGNVIWNLGRKEERNVSVNNTFLGTSSIEVR